MQDTATIVTVLSADRVPGERATQARYHGSVEKAHGSGYVVLSECDCDKCWDAEINHRRTWGTLAFTTGE